MNRLLIVESPTKAKTIKKMLGSDYTIMASMGHVRDLPEHVFGVDLNNNFEPQYVDSERSSKIVKELRAAAKVADEIYLAPDPDREGEAIAWHLAEVLKKNWKKDFHRVTFHEITRNAIERALDEKSSIDMNLVDAQQARRVLDRIVGYQVSPLLWSRLEKGISAGRVQSVALRLVVERERAIQGFVPEEYWVFSLLFRCDDGREFKSRLFKIDSKDFKITSAEEAEKALQAILNGEVPTVRSVTTADRRRNAPPPFTTSTLQQSAGNTLHFSANNTMSFAQQLYEGMDVGEGGSVGLITYMRTDSVTIAKEAQQAALEFIKSNYGEEYCPARPNYFKNKAAAQEAHEAIRPTDVNRTPEMMAKYLEPSLLKLYTLIWRRFTASQMAPSIQSLTTVDIGIAGADSREYTFRSTATVPVFAGFTKVFGDESKSKDERDEALVLGSLRERNTLNIADVDREQKFTEPPPRFTEASLIKELEENGIGRPSTYASILRTIQSRNYVAREQGKLFPTDLGFRVCDFLVAHLPELFNVKFTADMESKLDEVEAGNVAWTDMMGDFYSKFAPWLSEAKLSDAPPRENVELLLWMLDGVSFAEPEKQGRRTYDDNKFCNSLREQLEKDGAITVKQYQALLALIAKYEGQLKPIELTPALKGEIDEAKTVYTERKERAEAMAIPAEKQEEYNRLFDMFSKVEWAEPTKRGRVTYDDKKFFNSLKKQVTSGKLMSEKQQAALVRMVDKYREALEDADFVIKMLAIPAKSAEDEALEAENAGVIGELLAGLSKVTQWAEPTKRGRFTYDDKAFYDSLSTQFANSRKLSDRQVAALEKLAARYSGDGEVVNTAEPKELSEDAKADLAFLGTVTAWAEPTKRGRFKVDDKAFYESLKKQSESGKALSSKQLAALSKLAEKYR